MISKRQSAATWIAGCVKYVRGTMNVERIGLVLLAGGIVIQYLDNAALKEAQRKADIERAEGRVEKLLEKAPRPIVFAADEQVPLTALENLFRDAKVRLRNVGKGNAYDLSVKVVYDQIGFADANGKAKSVQDVEEKMRRQKVCSGLTLAAGDQIPVERVPVIAGGSADPQLIRGWIEMQCLDEEDNRLAFVQHFELLVHREPKNPHVHVTFNSPEKYHSAFDRR